VNQETLAKEFDSQNIPYRPQPIVKIFYKGSPLDKIYQPDFICFGEIIVEIKALSKLTGNEKAQVIN
jgi:GxxExxY protein